MQLWGDGVNFEILVFPDVIEMGKMERGGGGGDGWCRRTWLGADMVKCHGVVDAPLILRKNFGVMKVV